MSGARFHGLLWRSDGQPRLVVPALVVFALATALAWAGLARARAASPPTDRERAAVLARAGRFAAAEEIFVERLAASPSVPDAIALVEIHAHGKLAKEILAKGDAQSLDHPKKKRADIEDVMSEDALDAVLAKLPYDVRLVARFVREKDPPDDVHLALEDGARRDPPVRWYNHVLAEDDLRHERRGEAEDHLLREALAFPDTAKSVETGARDVDVALELLMTDDEWDRVRTLLADPRVAANVDTSIRADLAVHDKDWLGALRWELVGYRSHLEATGLFMAAIAALAWGFFACRLGKLGERPVRKLLFYVAAFALGVLSIGPTLALIFFEQSKLHLVQTGEPVRDALFFVFGVGLREEASKLLMFALLLPALRKWGDKLDVLVAGGLVGLGFAAEENLSYLASGDLHTGLGRFLTANFLHMAMTGILATALDDMVSDRGKNKTQGGATSDFSRISLMVVALHGAYDFLLSHEEYGGSYMAMAVFVFLTRLFLNALEEARRKVDRGLSLLHAFVFAFAVVTGVSAAFAAMAVGPTHAAVVLSEGLLGEAIIVIVFVRQLRTM